MGAYRLLLAVLVAVSHMGVTFMGINPGAVAVVSFLIISGFVMTSLIERTYNTPGQIRLFYMDRLLRLYPQFLVYFVLSCAVIHFLLPGTPPAAALTLENIATSLPIVPLGFYMFGITVPEILPPAWSLGLEMCFYLLIPFLILYRMRGIAFALSVTVFMVASLGYLDTDIYGYRLLPGVLFIFLCGSYLYRAQAKGLWIASITIAVAALMFLTIIVGIIPRRPLTAEVTLGIALGLPTVFLLSRLKHHRLDEFLGNISYGVFLNHFVVIYVLRAFWPVEYSILIITVVLVLSLAMSGVSYYAVERPALKLRHALRAGVKDGVMQTPVGSTAA
ncbi:Peptidoglycan/LPS O-acetylase OafA/YrhL, contains acyltransferase and SGNH-hydrolase domains [Pseudomonas sp. NFACC23-1]|nr:Peptidoglycan/LPS O-acetylase OafA/YrhL, contains acyltransferase and SGNH-hydrolase domains [Pseudomonas sp. NFACC17-2]SEJ75521.1 Peptidoglycan/LPS O-acetylase OafA/YrhL, contains acyltransferase and SGNH-hydrolase domains [Pseudomonas sp. NFACC23-1]SFW86646.1 Peptidoglycan/LPS O-acetylase OafA/YrhL, contains acyltransferase and SGNH-hydrolase domains [Pseudomonas sp. NFACC16-2]